VTYAASTMVVIILRETVCRGGLFIEKKTKDLEYINTKEDIVELSKMFKS